MIIHCRIAGPGLARKLLVVALLTVAALPPPGECADNPPGRGKGAPGHPRQAVPAIVEETVEGWLDQLTDTGTPGVVIRISTPYWEGTWTRGTADMQTQRPVSVTDTFRIASISKTFTATAVLQLVDEGLLSLADTLDMFGNGGFTVPGASAISVCRLLNHTSGLSDWADSTAARDKLCSVAPAAAPLLTYTPQEMIDMAVATGPYFPPGEGWAYSNTNYVLLGMIVEWLTHSEVTGTYLGEEITTRILRPLGLDHTYYPSDSVMPEQPMHSYWVPAALYAQQTDPVCPGWSGYTEGIDGTGYDPSQDFGSGAMISTLDDLETWCDALVHGTLLSESSHREQLTLTAASALGAYGLGVMYIARGVGHDGEIFVGYNSAMFYLPAWDTTIIVLLNGNLRGQPYSGGFLYNNLAEGLFPRQPRLDGGDYDGTGKPNIAVFRPGTGLWAVKDLGRVYFGDGSLDIPANGDYDGDGYADVAIYRRDTGLWAIKGVSRTYYGAWHDTPVPGDYDGDGCCDIAVFRGFRGNWYEKGVTRFSFGRQFDLPVPADYDGDGTDEAAVFRPSSVIDSAVGLWAIRGRTRFYYGKGGDIPVPGAYQWYGSHLRAGPFRDQ
ncbi:MAG: serine hydrolase domain-containing protein, partial [PVC group bacterium]